MPSKLTEPRAWREIAERIVEGKWWQTGLCSEVRRLGDTDLITSDTTKHMYRRLELYLDGSLWAYPYGKEYEEARILAALWMALEAEEKN